jgi:hypothetical protein
MSDIMETASKEGFIGHVFNFNANAKEEMMNIVQYAILAVIPVVLLNKSIQRFIPEVDDEKSSLEIVVEVVVQLIFMFLGIFFIDRLVTFVPTYSTKKYEPLSVINIILSMLVITLSLQTRLGEKVSILVDRVNEMWSGSSEEDGKKKKKKKRGTSVNSNANVSSQSNPVSMPASSPPGSTSIGTLPPVNYDSMYQQQPTPLVNAAEPSMETFEPMAANSGGGGAFGSAF